MRLSGKKALVTGGGSGIGREVALSFAREGAVVAVADIDGEAAGRVVDDIEMGGGVAVALALDVTSPEQWEDAIARTVPKFDGLDVLYNSAAITSRDLVRQDTDVAEIDLDLWRGTLDVNLTGTMLGCRYAVRHMRDHGGGSIINTSSAAGILADTGHVAYASSKAGVNALTRSVATRFGKLGIRCNSIAPGLIETAASAQRKGTEIRAIFLRSHLTPRLGRPSDIANFAVYLASNESEFVTGQVFSVDGGFLAHWPTIGELTRAGLYED
jgi:NAD(P)-dependent dehydrogenase (short-subunit alcohol dehydrogenase family)